MSDPSRAPTSSVVSFAESTARERGVRSLPERDLGRWILARHEPESAIAFGVEGEAERTAERLLSDVARVVAVLPQAIPGDPREILCVAGDRYHFTVALLAAWQRGHRVALPPNAQVELLRALSDDEAIALVIHDTDEMSGLDLRPLLAEEVRATPAEPIELPSMPESRHLVSVWTSGSTGEHQRHPKTAGQLFDEALTLAEHFELGPGTRVAATVPSHHIYGLLFAVLVPLLGGGAFLRETPLHAGVIRAALEQTGAGVLVSVPAHLRALRILDPGQLPALTRVFSSGAPLPPATARMLWERFELETTEVLGSTETGGIAWRISGADEREPEWTPLPGVQIDRLDDGRLTVDSPFLDPRVARPWITADKVEPMIPGGSLREGFRHVGRIDGVVKVGGKRIALAELERRLLDVPGVEDAAVAAVEVDSARGHETLAAVVAPGLSVEHLRTELRRWLDPVVIPRRLRLVDALPREPNGKLTRKRLLELFEQPKSKVRTLDCRPVASETADARFEVYVPRDLMALRGHFRDHPIVPGVVQLELAEAQARLCWPELGGLRRVLRLKFVRPLGPGDRVELVLRRARANAVEFVLRSFANETMSTGLLEFADLDASAEEAER
ncbi:AMP-binding protein [Nannocystaceae bacterium ST9]